MRFNGVWTILNHHLWFSMFSCQGIWTNMFCHCFVLTFLNHPFCRTILSHIQEIWTAVEPPIICHKVDLTSRMIPLFEGKSTNGMVEPATNQQRISIWTRKHADLHFKILFPENLTCVFPRQPPNCDLFILRKIETVRNCHKKIVLPLNIWNLGRKPLNFKAHPSL
jgi:hypothetical protein